MSASDAKNPLSKCRPAIHFSARTTEGELMNNQNQITRRVVLYNRDGQAQHFDVSVDLQEIAQAQAERAMRNRSRISVVSGGAVKVQYVP